MLVAAQNRIRSEGIALLDPLDTIIDNMRQAAADEDSEHLNRLDLEFHRYAVSLSENRLGMKVWEGISQHVLITFEMEIYRIPDAQSVVAQHIRLKKILAEGNEAVLAEVLLDHITGYRSVMLDRDGAASAGTDTVPSVPAKRVRKV